MPSLTIFRLAFSAFALLILSACSGLAGEPLIVRTVPLPTVTPTPIPDLGRPPARVDLARGAAIFGDAQGCAQCHGVAGQWDGPSAAAFVCKPRLADPENRGKTPLAWFGLTTNGNNGAVTCLMPPWRARLDEQARWDVVSFAYSLRYTPEQLVRGGQVWESRCAACHGAVGKGDATMPDLTEPAYLIAKSDVALFQALTNGIPKAPNHVFTDLSEADRYAVVAFLRALSWDSADILLRPPEERVAYVAALSAPPAATEEPTPSPSPTAVAAVQTFTVRGAVRADPPLAEGQLITLRVIALGVHSPRELASYQTTIRADQTFEFDAVLKQRGAVYVASAEYDGVLQFSSPLLLSEDTPALTLDLPLFPVSADSSDVVVELQRLFVDVIAPNRALIQGAARIRNTGRRVLLTDQRAEDGQRISLTFELPVGAMAVRLAAESAARFRVQAAGSPQPRIVGIAPLLPSEVALLQFSYELPFAAANILINQPNRYRVNALIVNVPQASGAQINDPRFSKDEPVALESGSYDTYVLREPLAANANITISVALGAMSASIADPALVILVVSILVLLLGTAGAIWWLNRRDQTVTASQDDVAKLIAQIAALDEQFERGELSAEAYQTQRNALKARLARLSNLPSVRKE
ncbi:MAG: c-type cytochrome [Anaerolineae bacterium]|nr:c-type cytochrome [Anaerolineae bacterium]